MRLPRLTFVLATLSLCAATPARAQRPDSARIATAEEDSIRGLVEGWYERMLGAAGLRPLDKTPLPTGDREVRIWSDPALAVPKVIYRFVDHRGTVTGSVIYYWGAGAPDTNAGERPGETIDDLLRYSLPGRCDHFARGGDVSVCLGRFTATPPWRTVLDTMEAHGLWTLPDPSTLPDDHAITLDGWAIGVELREGSSYRSYRYDNPQAHRSWPSAAEAVAISRALDTIRGLGAPADVQRHYRGVTTGRYGSVFHDCAGGDWKFDDDLRGMIRRRVASDSISLGDTTGVADSARLYYVEVIGELTPEWLARRWQVAQKRVLQPSRLLVARPAPGRECPAK